MKISREQKKENRKIIIRGAVDLISEKGFKSTTMRSIAKAAGMGEATIYNYFSTKEAILYAYYQDHMQTCIESLKQVEDFHSFSLQEQLQVLFDTSLNLYLEEREFVAKTFAKVFLSGQGEWSNVKPIQDIFISAVQDMLAAAAQVDEIPEQVFQSMIGQFFMDAYFGAVYYWINDTSEGFSNSSVIIDQGLDLACALLKAGIANKVFNVATFLFKTHVLTRLDQFSKTINTAGNIKKRFMEAMNEK